MSELTGQPASASTLESGNPPPEPTVPAITPAPEVKTSFVNEDGTLAEGWLERLEDENLRRDGTLVKFASQKDTTFETFARTIANLRKQVPMDKVTLPTETSPPEIWNEFYKAIGRPDTPEEYVIQRPDAIPEENWSSELVTETQKLFHTIGLNQKQVKALVDFDNLRTINGMKAIGEADERTKEEASNELRKRWGMDYDANMHLANRVIAENCPPDQKAEFLQKFGNDPDFAEFAVRIANKFTEHKIITDVAQPSKSIVDIDEQIKELRAKDGYMKTNHPDHSYIMSKIDRLYAEKKKIEQNSAR